MEYSFASTILKQSIQIGKTTVPLGLIPVFILCFGVVIGLNAIYLNRYGRILHYLKINHPDLYERVRRKPDVGPFYSTAHNPSKALLALAKQSHLLNDPKLEHLLSDFVQFDQKFWFVGSIAIVAMLLVVFVVGILLST